MKNVTITLDDATSQWLRSSAALRRVSVSGFVGDLLRDHVQQERRYELAMRQYLSLEPRPLGGPGQDHATREDLHDRSRLR